MSDIFNAVANGDLARVQELLAQGGWDLAASMGDDQRTTVLYLAAIYGHLDVAKALIRAGAPLNVLGETRSALHAAVDSSHYDLAALLVEEGAEVDARGTDGLTPLAWATNRSIAALLIRAGADISALGTGPRGGPLHRAIAYHHLDVLQEILSHPDTNVNLAAPGWAFITPLHVAAVTNASECAAALLAAGADPCATDSKALLPVWKDAPEEPGELFSRLKPEVQQRIRIALCTLHHTSPHHLPEHIRMRLLHEILND